jgi:dCMP deaminase
MKQKIISHRLKQALSLANLSSCKRRGVGAVAVTSDNITISEAYNGWIRGSAHNTCAPNNRCNRELLQIDSGTKNEIGCIHAEENLIINAARTNNSLMGTTVFVTTYPCLSCAKLLVQAGVSKLYVISKSYPNTEGLDFLVRMNIDIQKVKEDEI